MPDARAPASKFRIFVRSFRTYKLARLLVLHIAKKAEEIGFTKPRINKPAIQEMERRENEAESTHAEAGKINPDGNEALLIEKVDKGSDDANACLEAGKFYAYRGKIPEAMELFKRAIKLEPGEVDAYYMLAWLYKDQGQYLESEELYNKIILINPESVRAYCELGDNYRILDKFVQSEESFKKAIKLDPENAEIYFKLGCLYLKQRKFLQAEDVLRKGLAINPEHGKTYGALVRLYEEIGNNSAAEEYRKKTEDLLLTKFNSVPRYNYLRLKEVLDKYGIKLVCVQYPMRSIRPLKDIFRGAEEGIIFVDNQASFRKAVKRDGYTEYFIDNFGGDFGHFTQKGNELLVEKIANAILKEVFNK
jgi:tetratricopeptide (TPR) repeat protein